MSFKLNPDLHYGWFSIPDRDNVFIYLKDIKENSPVETLEVMDAIFQLIHILGQTLPTNVDVWVDWENEAPESRCKILSLPLVEEHPIDQMHKFLGPTAQVFFPLAKLILYAHANLHRLED